MSRLEQECQGRYDYVNKIFTLIYKNNLETRKNNALKGTGLFTSYNVSKDFEAKNKRTLSCSNLVKISKEKQGLLPFRARFK